MKRILLTLFAAIVVAAGVLTMSMPRAHAQRAVTFTPGLTWFNVARPLTWRDLRGRAVLLDFFTPGCINCVHMLPVEAQLEKHFGTRLAVVGIDSPKFAASKTKAGLESFIQRYEINHPVALDPDMSLWNAYGVQAWPTLILVAPDGVVLQQFIGEQTFAQLAKPIAAALAGAPPAARLPKLPLRPQALQPHPLETPSGIAVSPQLVAVADTAHNRIVLANHAGQLVAIVGNGHAGHADGSYAQAEFNRPHGLAFHDGALYVADTNNQLIRKIDLATHAVTTVAGNGQREYASSGSAPAHDAPLNSPWDLAWAGNMLYIAMAGDHQVWRYDPATGRIGPWAGTGAEGLVDGARGSAEFAQPTGLSANGNTLYDADPESSSIRAIALPGGNVTTLIGKGLFKFGLRNGAARDALLQHAEGLAWHGGDVYIADTFNNALRKLDLATHQVSTVAALLDRPVAIASLSAHELLVAEANGDRIDAVELPSGKVTPWKITGLDVPAAHPATRSP
ncbi:MAG TPA: thioredoxin-like domain-containing protein [Rhodanobacteraceae bacterium]